MSRRRSILPFAMLLAALALAACGSGSAGPKLTDPKQIVTAAITATEAAKTVHVDIALKGTATVVLPIAGSSGTPIDLTGTTIVGDVDLANAAAKATFQIPAVANLSGEVIVVDGTTYLRTSLTGAKYRVTDAGSLPLDPTSLRGVIHSLGALLALPGVTPVKGDDTACGTKTCYSVRVNLTAAQIAALAGAQLDSLPIHLAGASVALTVLVEQDLPNHLAGLNAVITQADGTALTIDLRCSNWDQPVTIAAPPADQVQPAG
jgi:hypothetical protein